MGGAGWMTVSYEPHPLVVNARLHAGPSGQPTYTLPPVAVPPSRAVWQRGGFIDAPPPERPENALRGKQDTQYMGPAPWIASPTAAQARGADCGQSFAPLACGLASAAAAPGGCTAGDRAAGDCAVRAGGAPASVRAQTRGNQRRQAGLPLIGVDGPYEPTAAPSSPVLAVDTAPGKGVQLAPKMATATAPPPPRSTAELHELRKLKGGGAHACPSSPSGGAAATRKKQRAAAPPPELILAERARQRVRARREVRARSEAPVPLTTTTGLAEA